MLDRLFFAHPRHVGESCAAHLVVAGRVGVALIVAGVAALLHGLVPALCVRTASDTGRRLHAPLAARVPQPGADAAPGGAQLDWQI